MNALKLILAAAVILTPACASAQFCAPSDMACQIDFMNGAASNDPTQVVAAYDLPPGQRWASESCRHIPCRMLNMASEQTAPAANNSNASRSGRKDGASLVSMLGTDAAVKTAITARGNNRIQNAPASPVILADDAAETLRAQAENFTYTKTLRNAALLGDIPIRPELAPAGGDSD